jgi:hydrogenase maturation protein HypF
VQVTGTVQGVGFRPFVHRIATDLGLTGRVSNGSAGVTIDVEGAVPALDELLTTLRRAPPPLATVADIRVETAPTTGATGFAIVASDPAGVADAGVPVDAGPCAACLTELGDPDDRRHRYAFTNCTDCGPRYTITHRVPYDRPRTTMAGFTMCARCQAEYDDPRDRRFHAQPNACPGCGPRLHLLDAGGAEVTTGDDALQRAVDLLRAGAVVAVKGIGGFHLAVDATDTDAVARLRRRKARDDKPFAVLVVDLAAAVELVELSPAAAELLTGPLRPIVLATRRDEGVIAPMVAPGMPELGILLPPSPLHHLLADDVGRPLVLTSGNRTDEPIAYRDDEVVAQLGPLVDAVLTHDRPIQVRCDDSVARADVVGAPQLVRRSRGFAPAPLRLPVPATRRILAVGAELKSTVAVAKGTTVVVSHHLGDLGHAATAIGFEEAIAHLTDLCGVTPELVAHDRHPSYRSTVWASELDLPSLAVQHHHAHVASCLTEHGRTGPVLGVAFDGLGWGEDDTAWGGEFLVCDLVHSRRVGHLATAPLPGGDAAVREPWRMAAAWVAATLGEEAVATTAAGRDPHWREVLAVARSATTHRTSSVGRLYDAVAALLGLHPRVSYEGQAAIGLEALARRATAAAPLAAPTIGRNAATAVVDPRPLIAAVVEAVAEGRDAAAVAAGFHARLGAVTVEVAADLAAAAGVTTVALSGGVFQNAVLSEAVHDGLVRRGVEVLLHRRVPANDGGISVGQAAIAAATYR